MVDIQILMVETIYLLLVTAPAFYIFYNIRKIYNFSSYKGLRYLSNVFLFIVAAFSIRYIIMLTKILEGDMSTIQDFDLLTLMMEFFMVLPGFFFLYSLVWRRFEKAHYSVGLNVYQLSIYALALIIAIIDTILGVFTLMYASQIILFLASSKISYTKYLKKKNNYRQMLFIAMVLFLFVWIMNLLAQYTIDIFPLMRLYAYIFTVAACMTLFFITIGLTRDLR